MREPEGFRHTAGPADASGGSSAPRHDRWVINKIRALGSWYTKGLDNGSRLRTAINSTESLDELRHLIDTFFRETATPLPRTA